MTRVGGDRGRVGGLDLSRGIFFVFPPKLHTKPPGASGCSSSSGSTLFRWFGFEPCRLDKHGLILPSKSPPLSVEEVQSS